MLLPLLLIALATGAATIIAYGTHPGWASSPTQGLEYIMLARRLDWPLIVLCLGLCMALLGLVISGRRRVWWLIGLAPVLALFVHRFAPSRGLDRLYILENPVFVDASQGRLPDDAWIVGVVFEDQAYALPYAMLYSSPVVFITDYDKRMMLLWSASANRALAYTITRDLKPRDLEIVSAPLDTLLLLNRRLGQFIIALTGMTVDGQKPVGLGQPLPTVKTTWSIWRRAQPATKLLYAYQHRDAPAAPLKPRAVTGIIDGLPAHTPVAVVTTSPPLAIAPDSVTANRPLNTLAGQTRLLLVRDPATDRLRGFDRHVNEDLFPTFAARTDPRRNVALVDSDSQSQWTLDGRCINGPLAGQRLREISVEQDVYWGVLKTWYPQLQLAR
ncbi:DUF3179 domain-containing (seleno)protein [Fontivita pretiosa]|uniref:DUF3179 domain-containing (seleno)protein n=1 Tax=Fontivita pretiosa TaxID=2989684 RepID=UPI003D16D823